MVDTTRANNTRLASLHLNITKLMSRIDIRRNFFLNRVNNLPNHMKDLPNVNKFKAEYDKMAMLQQ